jgi:hypothetical protein
VIDAATRRHMGEQRRSLPKYRPGLPRLGPFWPSVVSGGRSSGQPPEYLDIPEILLPPWSAVAQMRELLLHGEHAGDAHGQY